MQSRQATETPSSYRWAAVAGGYMLLCGLTVVVLLSDLLGLLADVIGVSTEYWMFLLASPAGPIGAAVWWRAVERRRAYSYLAGILVGLSTALLTGGLWTGRFLQVWSLELAASRMNALLITVVVGFAAVAGVIAALPLMYLRRRVVRRVAGEGNDHSSLPRT